MRRIVSEVEQSRGAQSETVDGYFDRIIKYVPADVIAAWVAISSLLTSVSLPAKWIILFIVAIVTVVWMMKQTGSSLSQSLLGSASFLVWAFALRSGPFADLNYPEQWGSIAIILFTLGIGSIVPKKSRRKS